jgi:hypothetical protein
MSPDMRTALSLICVLAACGPESRRPGSGDLGPDAANTNPTGVEGPGTCSNALDDDGDGLADCADQDCSGVDACPVCGAVENPEVTPLALPDGEGDGTMCSTDSQCTSAAEPNCVFKECHASYNSQLNFIGFPEGAKLDDPSKLLKVCVNMEHSWLRDLQMELITPDGAVFILHKFADRTGRETHLGNANDADTAANPVPGQGMEYCWTPDAPTTMMDAATGAQLNAGDYKSVAPWTALTGASLNGVWEMRVTDLWPADNGFLFNWSIAFDPSLVSDCAGPIIL